MYLRGKRDKNDDDLTTDESQPDDEIIKTQNVRELAKKLQNFFEERARDEPTYQKIQNDAVLDKISRGIIEVKVVLHRINRYIPTIYDGLDKDIDESKLQTIIEHINMTNVADVIIPLRKCVCTVSSSLMYYEFVDDIRTLMHEYNTIVANYKIIKSMAPVVGFLTSQSKSEPTSNMYNNFHVNSMAGDVFVNKDDKLINLLDTAINNILKLGSFMKTIYTPLITREAHMSITLAEKHAQPSDGNLYILDDWLKEIKYWALNGRRENYARPIAYKKSDFTALLTKYIDETTSITMKSDSDSDSTPKHCRDFVSILGYVEEDFNDALVGLRKCKTTFCKIMHDEKSTIFNANNNICQAKEKSSGGKRTRKNLNPIVKIKTHNERNTKRAGKMYYAFGHSKRRS